MKSLTRWPVTVSYYDRDAKAKDGEQTPVYAMSFELYRERQSRAHWCWTTMISSSPARWENSMSRIPSRVSRRLGVAHHVVPANAGTHQPPAFIVTEDIQHRLLAVKPRRMGPCVRRDDGQFRFNSTNTSSRSRGGIRPRFAINVTPSPIRGRRESRMHAAPAVSCAIKWGVENAHEHTGPAETSDFPCAGGEPAYT